MQSAHIVGPLCLVQGALFKQLLLLKQVSTWFANARRRLKKENKMTWEPKNKLDDEDVDVSDDDDKDKDDDRHGKDPKGSRALPELLELLLRPRKKIL